MVIGIQSSKTDEPDQWGPDPLTGRCGMGGIMALDDIAASGKC